MMNKYQFQSATFEELFTLLKSHLWAEQWGEYEAHDHDSDIRGKHGRNKMSRAKQILEQAIRYWEGKLLSAVTALKHAENSRSIALAYIKDLKLALEEFEHLTDKHSRQRICKEKQNDK